MAMACMDDVQLQWGGGLISNTSLGSMGHPGIFAGQEKGMKRGKVLKAKASGGQSTGTGYPTTDYATNFYVGASTGTAYTAGSGITVTTANNSLSNSYTLNDALTMK